MSASHPPPLAGEVDRGEAARRRGPSRVAERKSLGFAKKLRRVMTHAEVILWQRLRRDTMHDLHFRRQHPIGPFIADFACAETKLVVEVDGETHGTEAERAYDRRRRAYFKARGWREIRVTNDDVYKNLDGVLDQIWRVTTRLRPPPPLRGPPPPPAGEDERGRS